MKITREPVRISEILKRIRQMLEEYTKQTALTEVSNREDHDAFKVLISTVLSHRTKDEVTGKASERLFAVYPDVTSLARGNVKRISTLIYPVGFYRTKARRVKEIARELERKYGGIVPESMEELLTLPAVGRKTANCVLVYAFQTPAIPVDTHVHRISNRLGLVETKTPEETETALTASIDRRYWLEINDLFVRFGQTICKPIGPRCGICSLKGECKYYREIVAPKLLVAATKSSRRDKTA
jgi:endonuclease III